MNIRKHTDYSAMYAELDKLMAAGLPQVRLYFLIGKAVSARAEKGAAVAASEYLQKTYPDCSGFSPRNLRRMREFYHTYEKAPRLAERAMRIGWTQNVVILEAELTIEERAWYLRAAELFCWSKTELTMQIGVSAHLKISLDESEKMCYTYTEKVVREYEVRDEANTFCVSRQHLQESDGRVCDEGPGKKTGTREGFPYRVSCHQLRGDWKSSVLSGTTETVRAWDRLLRQNGPTASKQRLREVRSDHRDGSCQSTKHVPHLRRRFRGENAPSDGVCGTNGSGGSRSLVHGRFRCDLAGCSGWMPGAA